MAKRSRKKRVPDQRGPKSSSSEMVQSPLEEKSTVAVLSNLVRALLIVAVGWWVFIPTLHGGWIWDDIVYIPQNPMMGDPNRLWKIWFQPGSFIEYYPIEQTVQWRQWELFHNDTLGYHVTNIVLHLISALLVWRLLGKLGLRLAWLGGLIFAIHPAMVESVAWMSELKNTLSLPPFLLAACAYIDYDNRGRRTDYFLSLGLFLVAMLCKISMALFPVIILLYVWWKRRRIGRSDLKAAIPFFVISLVLGVITILAGIWFRPTHHMAADHVEVGDLWVRFDLTGLLTAWYFYQVVCPITHSFFYPKWNLNPSALWQFLPWPILIGIGYVLWIKRRDWGRSALFGLGFFFINLAPFLGLTVPSYMNFTWAMDHFLYLPIIGLIGLAVAGLEQIDRQVSHTIHLVGIALVTTLMVGLSMISHRYAGTFSDDATVWANTIKYAPESETAHEGLGNALARKGQLAEAIEQLNLAARLSPLNGEIDNNLGQALARSGRLAESKGAFDAAIRIMPSDASALANRGHLWQIMGDQDEAIADLTRAIELNPDLPQPYINRGVSRQIRGDWPGALTDLQQFCLRAPHEPNADYARLGIWLIRAQNNQRTDADRELTEAFVKNWNAAPDDWTSQIARFLLGRINEAQFLAAAVATDPVQDRDQHCEAWYYAGMMRLLGGDKTVAMDDFHKSLATGESQSLIYVLAQGELATH